MSSFNTQAVNFAQKISTYVDPRTGLFISSLELLSILANKRMGPALDLSIQYAPFSDNDIGFGNGFRLGLSYYDYSNAILYLSSGEQYKVIETNNQPIITQKKLNSFIFVKDYDKNEYRIIWKSGVIETLFGPDHFSNVKQVKKITSSYGDNLYLSWMFIGQMGRLEEIKDDNNIYCIFSYNGNISTDIQLYPGTAEQKNLKIRFSNNYISSIEDLSLNTPLEWSFQYTQVDNFYLLSGLAYPTGLVETVNYTSGIMRFPTSAGLPSLPAVTRVTTKPGFGQQISIVVYEYSTTNHLGYGTNNPWSPDKDYLFGILDEYIYWVKSTTLDNEIEYSTTTSTYNRFHLLINEKHLCNGSKIENIYEYYAKQGVLFEDQPPQYQLPRSHETIYTDKNGNSRVEKQLSEFDENGNATLTISNDGSKVAYEYYNPSVDINSPIDPNGFVRFLKKESFTPTETNFNSPEKTVLYTYESINRITPNGTIKTIMPLQKEVYFDNTLSYTEQYKHYQTDSFYGRLKESKSVFWLDSNGIERATLTSFEWTYQSNELTQTISVTTHDNLKYNTSNITSIFTGKMVSLIDIQGNTSHWQYDGLNRVTREIQNRNTQFEQSKTFSYSMLVTGNQTKETDIYGNTANIYFDGKGREIKTEVNNQDNTLNEFIPYMEQTYDFNDRINSRTNFEYFKPNVYIDRYLQESTISFIYDGWGLNSESVLNKKYSSHQIYNPIDNSSSSFRGGISANNNPPETLGIVYTEFDKSNHPIKTLRYFANGTLHSKVEREFDGYGQLRKETDELGRTTEWQYDVFGRVIYQILPDGAIVERKYANFTNANLPTSIALTDESGKKYNLGTQSFDGLERLTAINTGGRNHQLIYDNLSQFPSRIKLTNGDEISYSYIPELNNAIANITTDQYKSDYYYNPKNSQLLQANNNNNSITFEYYNSGMLKSENSTLDAQASSMTTSYSWSAHGAIDSYIDTNNKQRNYYYDQYGFLSGMLDSSITAKFKRDIFGRTITIEVESEDHSCITHITYDDFDNETERKIVIDESDIYILSTEYYLNGQIATNKSLHNNELIRNESFNYDIRNRLVNYLVDGSLPPTDQYGNTIASQEFIWDAMNNMRTCITNFSSGTNTATFHFENSLDPTQLTKVTNTHFSYPLNVKLAYDSEGRMTIDQNGAELKYNNLGQLISSNENGVSTYAYDAMGRIIYQEIHNSDARILYYISDTLSGEKILSAKSESIRYITSAFGHLAIEEL